jgi:hypothetical protein
MFNSK